ncbi:uncharacterized protein LOC123533903 [Mercenaria mercenaria]|uniref:uncharacterized protein LOC123533903 n=1 Tax=Mercenaria mercenaria TaxID=6596 RepID=UPI001E1D4A46|nr:uncharacterized protein LOC123533903 [Mercenaria mercenaria]
MPICVLYTNMKRSELDKNIEERMARCISETLDKPLEIVFVSLFAETPSFCAGSRDPSMICQIHSKKVFDDPNKVSGYYPKFFETLKETTKLPGNRIIVELFSVPETHAEIGN